MVWIMVISGLVSVSTLGKVKFEQSFESSEGIIQEEKNIPGTCKAGAKILVAATCFWGGAKKPV